MNMTSRTTLIQRYVTLFCFAGFLRLEGAHAHALLTSHNYSQQVLPEVVAGISDDAPKKRHRQEADRGNGTALIPMPSKEEMLAMQHLTRAEAQIKMHVSKNTLGRWIRHHGMKWNSSRFKAELGLSSEAGWRHTGQQQVYDSGA
jgi:hypothetical protein